MEGEILKFSKNHFRRGGCRSRIPNLNPFGLLEVDEKSGAPKRRNENKKRLGDGTRTRNHSWSENCYFTSLVKSKVFGISACGLRHWVQHD